MAFTGWQYRKCKSEKDISRTRVLGGGGRPQEFARSGASGAGLSIHPFLDTSDQATGRDYYRGAPRRDLRTGVCRKALDLRRERKRVEMRSHRAVASSNSRSSPFVQHPKLPYTLLLPHAFNLCPWFSRVRGVKGPSANESGKRRLIDDAPCSPHSLQHYSHIKMTRGLFY